MVDSINKYLGLPINIGRSKKAIYDNIIYKTWKKVKGLKKNFLSQAGKSVLQQSVVEDIPTYIMGCFLLPTSVCTKLNSLMSNFWWGAIEKKTKIQ
jgi:hypothetical protein